MDDRDVRVKEYEALVDIYKHHFDQFMKMVTLVLAFNAAASGYLFAKDVGKNTQVTILALLVLLDLYSIACCIFASLQTG